MLEPGGERDLDWHRQLSKREQWFWYSFAFVTYVGASLVEKGLLNWLVGPAWVVAVVVLGPRVVDRLRRRLEGTR